MREFHFALVVCLSVTLGQRGYAQSSSPALLQETSEYVFLTDQSAITWVGGPSGSEQTYSFEGWLRLMIDVDAGIAKFDYVYATLTEETPLLPNRDLIWLFSSHDLVGTVVDSNTVEFRGEDFWATRDLFLRLDFDGGLVRLTGQATPLPEQTVFPPFEINALAKRKYGGGIGRREAPYLIYTAEQMNEIGLNSSDRSSHFRLMEDIDLGAYADNRFHPVAGLSGVFDGQGRTISHFTYTCADGVCVGLFAQLGRGGVIKDLTLIDPNVQAGEADNVGSLVGCSDGLLSRCYVRGAVVSGHNDVGCLAGTCALVADCHAEGTVSGNFFVGGLAGYARDKICSSSADAVVTGVTYVGGLAGTVYALVDRCLSVGAVSGKNEIGGLAGFTQHTLMDCRSDCSTEGDEDVGGLVGAVGQSAVVVNCCATGKVSGRKNVGGLIGHSNNTAADAVSSSFWDTEASGLASSQGGTGLTTERMQTPATYLSAGWQFVGEPNDGVGVWFMGAEPGYPRLAWEAGVPSFYGGGAGKPNDPYLIYTAAQLNAIGTNVAHWDRCFRLMADIDLRGYRNRFNLIGGRGNGGFTGVFDGQGRTISNFTYIAPQEDSVGLFRGSYGRIMNLGLIDPNVCGRAFVGSLMGEYANLTGCYARGANVSGRDQVGGLAGYSLLISNCYVRGRIAGDLNVGGLTGFSGYTVSRSFADAEVAGRTEVGGLVGQNGGPIADCYSRGSVAGEMHVGGLAGSTWDLITRTYSVAHTTGQTDTGGLVGYVLPGFAYVIDSFWDVSATGQPTSCGGTPLATEQMGQADVFLEAGWDFVGETQNGLEDIWWIPEGQSYPGLWWEPQIEETGAATDD